MWLQALSINPYDCHAVNFYGEQHKEVRPLMSGMCGYAVNMKGEVIDIGVYQKQEEKAIRFASYNVLTSELVSTGFEHFPDNKYMYEDEFFVFPSDKVLGLSVSSKLRYDIFPNSRSQYPFNYGLGEAAWEHCNGQQYAKIAEIDALYAQLIGAKVNSTWIIATGYFAISKGEKHRLRVQLFEDSLVIRGFNMNSITVKRDKDKIYKEQHYAFDVPTKWVNPPIPRKARKFDFVQFFKFTRNSPRKSNYTVQVQMYQVTWFHQVHILHKIVDERGTVFELTGSPQSLMVDTSWYWFGHLTQFPKKMVGEFSKWYYFDSFLNCDVTQGEKGVKLKNVLKQGEPIIDALIGYWDAYFIGKLCTHKDTNKQGYLTYDFRMITFDGEIHPVSLTGILSSAMDVKDPLVPQCA
jgi:hypothetical protein